MSTMAQKTGSVGCPLAISGFFVSIISRYNPEPRRRLSRADLGTIDTRRQAFCVEPERIITFGQKCLIAMHLAAGSSEDPARHCARGLHSEEDSAGTGVIYGPMQDLPDSPAGASGRKNGAAALSKGESSRLLIFIGKEAYIIKRALQCAARRTARCPR
jgi:hypothetical protein